MEIRPETLGDRDSIRRVTIDAFSSCEFGHNGEADLVDLLRENCPEIRSLVATANGLVVGHILFSPVTVRRADDVIHGMGLAPMAVAPDHQRRGVGTALVETGLKQLAAAKCPFVVVIGHPQYYPRFGFVPAADYGIAHGFAGIPQSVLFIRFFDSDIALKIRNGILHYRHEFGSQSG